MTEGFDVSSVCNVLVDLLLEISQDDFETFDLQKGKMHLVDGEQHKKILSLCQNELNKVELGGSSLNTIKALAQLGCKVSFSGMIGNDSFGSIAEKSMLDLGIHSYLQKNEEEDTGKSLILVTPDGERTMNTFLGASCLYNSEPSLVAPVKKSRFFHFSGYQWACSTQRQIALECIKLAKKNSCLVSFDLADPFVVKAHKDEFLEMIQNDVDIFFGNREESRLLFEGLSEKDFVAQNPEVISVLKMDEDGALIYHKGDSVRVNPIETDVVDTTGAGDMFAAGFLFGLSRGLNLSVCGYLASVLASDVISHFGATLSDNVIDRVLTEASKAGKI